MRDSRRVAWVASLDQAGSTTDIFVLSDTCYGMRTNRRRQFAHQASSSDRGRYCSVSKEKEFDNIIELAERVNLTRAEIIKLSKAGALNSLVGNRYQSYWSALNVKEPLPTLSDQSVKEATVLLKKPWQ